MRILIVDDDPAVAESCRRILSAEGFRTAVAGNARDAALMLSSDTAFDLMLTDIKMPQQDGFQLIAQTRRAHPDLRILMMTGYLMPETIEQGRFSGVDGFIAKPFTPGELLAAVRKAAEIKEI